jgi:hypothetical protein
MKTIEIKLYSFNELSEDAKEKAINELYDINLFYEWWDSIYEDAKNIDIKITGFDIDRGRYCKIENLNDWHTIADKIMQEHGENCETYKIAESFLKERDEIIDTAIRDEDGDFEDENEIDNLLDNLESDFKNDISEEYLSMLRKGYDYLSSPEAIIETIEANDYEFTENGKRY